uniref:MATH domain-containing protein n=1 Tax=Leersia perrieri TaxID=77586 RepID=A0A0D9WXT6_9ORYZ
MSIQAGVTASPPSASTIISTATTGGHILKITGYSHARLLANGGRLESAKFKAAGHTWKILLYPHGTSRTEMGGVALFVKLVDRSRKAVDAEVRFSLHVNNETCVKPELRHTFESGGLRRRGSKRCGFSGRLMAVYELEEMRRKYDGEEDDSVVIQCDIKVMNKPEVRQISLGEIDVVCRCNDDTCKRQLHVRSLDQSAGMKPRPCGNVKGVFARVFSCFLA